MRLDTPGEGEFARLMERVRRLETASWLENASASRGTTRFLGNESLKVVGSAVVSGWLIVTGTLKVVGSLLLEGVLTATGTTNLNGPVNIAGTQTITGTQNITGAMNVNGPLNVAGTETVTGILNVNGPWNLAGTGGITGNVSSTGTWTQTGSYTLTGAGKINVGTGMFLGPTSRGPGVQFDDGSTLSKQSYGTALNITDTIYLSASPLGVFLKYGSTTLTLSAFGVSINGATNITGAFTATSKSFKIPHPTKPDMWLLHGVTESDEHGVEYRGDAVIGDNGSMAVALPEYFEALTEPGATVYVTGRGFCADWSDVEGNGFTVTGEPGKRFSWLVKAARSDVILQTEEPMEAATAP